MPHFRGLLGVRPQSASSASARSRAIFVSGFGHFGGSPRRPRLWGHAGGGLAAQIGRGRGPGVQSGLSLAVAGSRPAGPPCLASPYLQSPLPQLSVRPNHSFKPTAGNGRDTNHASWAGGGLTKALGNPHLWQDN